MRPWILAFTAAAALLTGSALAAPTCQDGNGDTIKCGTPGAMPVGWTLSPKQRLERKPSIPLAPNTNEMVELICVIGMLLALIALMPEFDGWGAGDWDEQEGDQDERK